MGFRNAVEEIVEDDIDSPKLCRSLRVKLSDLGFADFFIKDTQRWRVLPSVLGGIALQEYVAILCGSRTPQLVESLRNVAELQGCKFDVEEIQDNPTLIRVLGNSDKITAIADKIDASFEPYYAVKVAATVSPILHILNMAPVESAPLNWQVRSFDFRTCEWVDGLIPNAACEFTPTHGYSKYYVHRKRGELLKIPKREALYVAAMLKRVRLIEYDANTMKLSMPLYAPMPELYARAACLCSYRMADILNNRIIYSGVPPDVAALLMVAAGQPHPGFIALPEDVRNSNE